MSLILGIESTCDETAASVVRDGDKVLSNVVATQFHLHARFRGVVPEIASRAHIENILPVVTQALSDAGVTAAELDAVAVAHRPGLIGCLLVGVTAAKTLAWLLGKPLLAVDHVHAHLYSVRLDQTPRVEFPAVGLVVSGGHTALYGMDGWQDVRLIGATIDDAVGEAYDKVAAMLGLPFPGGPQVARLADGGNAKAFAFPRTLLGRESLDFSFSGLKTAVLYALNGIPGKPRSSPAGPQELADLAASFQAACADILATKVARAVHQTGARSVIVGGGVSSNLVIRARLMTLGLPVHLPIGKYCTDQAAMSAGLGELMLRNGQTAGLDLEAIPFSVITR